jgi:tRNA(fMet)-specific endonuclease VapC
VNISYLIDTDWTIDHLNQIEKVTHKLEELRPFGIALSVISIAELYEGVYYSRDALQSEKALKTFLRNLHVLGIDENICQVFGQERGRLRRLGTAVSDFDLLIASTCLYYDLTLLTNNRKHFEKVEGLKFYSIS